MNTSYLYRVAGKAPVPIIHPVAARTDGTSFGERHTTLCGLGPRILNGHVNSKGKVLELHEDCEFCQIHFE